MKQTGLFCCLCKRQFNTCSVNYYTYTQQLLASSGKKSGYLQESSHQSLRDEVAGRKDTDASLRHGVRVGTRGELLPPFEKKNRKKWTGAKPVTVHQSLTQSLRPLKQREEEEGEDDEKESIIPPPVPLPSNSPLDLDENDRLLLLKNDTFNSTNTSLSSYDSMRSHPQLVDPSTHLSRTNMPLGDRGHHLGVPPIRYHRKKHKRRKVGGVRVSKSSKEEEKESIGYTQQFLNAIGMGGKGKEGSKRQKTPNSVLSYDSISDVFAEPLINIKRSALNSSFHSRSTFSRERGVTVEDEPSLEEYSDERGISNRSLRRQVTGGEEFSYGSGMWRKTSETAIAIVT